jgi:hypothetical protein
MKKAVLFIIFYSTIINLYSQDFSFGIFNDQRLFTCEDYQYLPEYTAGALIAMANIDTLDFLVVPGDLDPAYCTNDLIELYFGEGFTWYPAVGNHDTPGGGQESYPGENMDFLRSMNDGVHNTLPNLVSFGPRDCVETTYSFDYGNCHFVVLNEYFDGDSDTGSYGDVVDPLYDWLVDDLSTNTLEYVFVIGHEPAFPQPDADNGRLRHVGDSLDQYPENRDRFWNVLVEYNVLAYLTGHTHNYSAILLDGVWQFDVGHARGQGDPGAPSTFCIVSVSGDYISLNTYREGADTADEVDYMDYLHSYNLHGTPPTPTNIEIEYVNSSVTLEWDYVPSAYYWIYGANDPTGEFFNVSFQGIFERVADKMTWTTPINSEKKYYHITRHD